MARVIPEKVIGADSGTATAHIAGGFDPRTGEYYAWYLGSDPTAWGARATKDGFELAGGPRIGGSVSQVSMEVFETRYPFLVEEYAFYPDSGGPGRFRGGMSGVTIMRPVGHECEVGGANDRCVIPPYGIFGGMPGLHGENKIIHADGSETPIDRAGGEIARDGGRPLFPGAGRGRLRRSSRPGPGLPATRHGHRAGVRRKCRPGLRRGPRWGHGAIDRQATEAKRARLKEEWKTGPDLHRPEDAAVRPETVPRRRHRRADTKRASGVEHEEEDVPSVLRWPETEVRPLASWSATSCSCRA